MMIDSIHLFTVTAKHLSITKAARELRVSQSTLSRKLAQIEENLGAKLFKRHARGIELTYSGRRYLEKIAPIMCQLEEAKRSLVDEAAVTLSIGACRGLSASLLPFLMIKFRETHPSVQLTLLSGKSSEVLNWLRESVVDIALVTSPTKSPLFQVERYRSEPLIAFVAASHPLARSSAEAIDLTDVPLIVRGESPEPTRTEIEVASLIKTRRKPSTAMRFGSSRAVKEAVRQSAGIGILYHDVVKREIDQGEFKAVTIPGLDLARQSYIVYLKDKPLFAVTREFLSMLRSSASQDSPIKMPPSRRSNGHGSGQARDYILRSKLL